MKSKRITITVGLLLATVLVWFVGFNGDRLISSVKESRNPGFSGSQQGMLDTIVVTAKKPEMVIDTVVVTAKGPEMVIDEIVVTAPHHRLTKNKGKAVTEQEAAKTKPGISSVQPTGSASGNGYPGWFLNNEANRARGILGQENLRRPNFEIMQNDFRGQFLWSPWYMNME